jgi:hypothetical protein
MSAKAEATTTRSDRHCQTGWADFCYASRFDGVACPEDSCDIDDGVRNPATCAKSQTAVWLCTCGEPATPGVLHRADRPCAAVRDEGEA